MKINKDLIFAFLKFFLFIFLLVKVSHDKKVEGCQVVMRDMYKRAGLQKIDEDSLDDFCKSKFRYFYSWDEK